MKLDDFKKSPLYGQWIKGGSVGARPAQVKEPEQPVQQIQVGEVIELSLPFCPSVNHYLNHGRHGTYITKQGRAFIRKVVEYIKMCQLNGRIGSALVDVAVVLHPPSTQVHDADNYNKVSFDSLTKAGFWNDDGQIKLFAVYMGPIVKHGRIDLAVRLHQPIDKKTTAADLLKRM